MTRGTEQTVDSQTTIAIATIPWKTAKSTGRAPGPKVNDDIAPAQTSQCVFSPNKDFLDAECCFEHTIAHRRGLIRLPGFSSLTASKTKSLIIYGLGYISTVRLRESCELDNAQRTYLLEILLQDVKSPPLFQDLLEIKNPARRASLQLAAVCTACR